ncbi:uncharacterized protein LOC114748437 [Neltuma alba]|uniref:uncharacterized protein LOC114748437 n=1 Tax=Neltuma alba TaxID=207710 RepID=UPI0010A33EC6|nr:uncharacterized protein LOC114748437 [Prosopis alba]
MIPTVSPNLKCWQSSLLTTPHSLCHSPKPPVPFHSPSLGNLSNSVHTALLHRLVSRSPFAGFKNFRTQRGKRACSAPADSDDILDPEMMKLVQEAEKAFNQSEAPLNGDFKDFSGKGSSEKFPTIKPDLLEPSELGIEPEPPSWPERDAMLRMNLARKLSCRELPLSIRIIKKKLQWQKNFKEASDFTCCSVKKTFSYMLFIYHELQNYALERSETLYREDLQDVMNKFRRDMDASFVWLFQKVFWKTPSFMLYTMVLLANFSVYSMGTHTGVSVTPTSIVTDVQTLSENKNKKGFRDAGRLWNSTVQEASRVRDESGTKNLDEKPMVHFVAPESEEIERNNKYEQYTSTDLHYKRQLYEYPNNSLLLSNYAQFLYLVVHDHDRAENYFSQSVAAEPQDAEAFCRYADFLWQVRNDLWGAEVRYLKAIEEENENWHYTSKYATFLWCTGAEDTCYPLYSRDNSQQQQ